jgi:hypothetical protein
MATSFAKETKPKPNETAATIKSAMNAKIKGTPQFSPKYLLAPGKCLDTNPLTAVDLTSVSILSQHGGARFLLP